MSINNYVDFIKSQGELIIQQGSVPWMKYQGVLIPAVAMPVYVDLTYDEAIKLVKQSNSFFLRYTTNPVQSPTNWWDMVCRKYDFNRVSSNTRSKIRRGLRRLEIKRVSPEWLTDKGYACHVESYKRYKHVIPESKQSFQAFLHQIDGTSIFDIWVSLKNGELSGYIICLVENNGVFMHTIDITSKGLHEYAAYAMIHQILEYYVNEKHIPVSNGSRSISHATDMQDFLCKFSFKREYSELHVIYRPDIKCIVCLLYPCRNILKYFNKISFIHKISSVLFQEEIVRNQNHALLSS